MRLRSTAIIRGNALGGWIIAQRQQQACSSSIASTPDLVHHQPCVSCPLTGYYGQHEGFRAIAHIRQSSSCLPAKKRSSKVSPRARTHFAESKTYGIRARQGDRSHLFSYQYRDIDGRSDPPRPRCGSRHNRKRGNGWPAGFFGRRQHAGDGLRASARRQLQDQGGGILGTSAAIRSYRKDHAPVRTRSNRTNHAESRV